MKKSIKIILILISSLILAAAVTLFILLTPVTSSGSAYSRKIEVPSGTSVMGIAHQLKEGKLIKSEKLFYIFCRMSKTFALKSGVYTVKSDMKITEIMNILSSGQQEYIKVSIPEGLTVTKIAARLEEHGVCKADEFKKSCKDPALLAEFGILNDSFEGFLFPDTYFFNPLMSGEAVVRQMVKTFYEKIKTIPGLEGKTPSELNYILTLASIVEREYRIDSEAKLISSVFTNRLKRNIGLYSCATIEYIITEIQGRPHPDVITYNDLKIDSPYNTYKWAGLPPAPISNPGLVALDAAANPAVTNYYFFRLVDANAGRHVFSKDFETHVNEGTILNTTKK